MNLVLRESSRDFWNPILIKDFAEMDRSDHGSGKTRYASIKKLFMEAFEKKEELTWIANDRAAVDVCLGFIVTFLNVDDGSMFRTGIPGKGGHFLFKWSGSKFQTSHNDVQYQPDKSSANFIIAYRPEEGKTYLCPGSYYNAH